MSEDEPKLKDEIRVLSMEEEISILKTRGWEQTDPIEKLHNMYDLIVAEVSAIGDEELWIQTEKDLQAGNLNPSKLQNWIDNGRDPKDFYWLSCHNRLNSVSMILTRVQHRAIQEGIIGMTRVPTVSELLQERLRRHLIDNMEEDDGREG